MSGIWPYILTFISEQTAYIWGKIDEKREIGDKFILILWLFLVVNKIYTFVGIDINSGEIKGSGKDDNINDWIYFISSLFVFIIFVPYNSFFYYVFLANS